MLLTRIPHAKVISVPISLRNQRGRVSSVGKALDCRAGGRGFDYFRTKSTDSQINCLFFNVIYFAKFHRTPFKKARQYHQRTIRKN